jgi:imidazolonepropionase-like amidohydrolase
MQSQKIHNVDKEQTMYQIRGLRVMILIGLCLSWAFAASAAPPGIVLTKCSMIDGKGSEPVKNAVILIKGGIIEYAGPAEEAKIPEGYQEINLRGGTVLPGFINAHVHKGLEKKNLRNWLKAGVTSVRDLGSDDSVQERSKMREKCMADPSCARVFIATPIINRKNGYGHKSMKYGSLEELRMLLSNAFATGVDVVKTSVENRIFDQEFDLISLEELRLITQEAHRRGLRVSAHITKIPNILLALQGGVDFFEHMVPGNNLSPVLAERIARRGIYWIPTLELQKKIGEEQNSSRGLDQAILNLGLYNKVGGLIALGTDFGGHKETAFDKGFPITEVRLMLKAGLTPIQVIVAGTKNAAIVSGKGDQLGTLEPGKWADIIGVDGDPLRDIEILKKVNFVMKGGEVVVPIH